MLTRIPIVCECRIPAKVSPRSFNSHAFVLLFIVGVAVGVVVAADVVVGVVVGVVVAGAGGGVGGGVGVVDVGGW